MARIAQNTLYLTTPGSYVSRDHLTVQIEVPLYPDDLPAEERTKDKATSWKKLAVPIHHLESICAFGPRITIGPHALELCWEHGVAVNYLGLSGHLQARLTGVADTSVLLRRAQFRAADDDEKRLRIARAIIAGKMHNARNSLLRAAREAPEEDAAGRGPLESAAHAIGQQIKTLPAQPSTDALRGAEGMASATYFSVFSLTMKQQREAFLFTTRSRRPPRDRINCLLSFLYALVRHDCIAALTAAGLDPFVGFLHVERPNRPALALDLMEELRPWLADRLALTLINRQQIGTQHFLAREGGAVELTEAGCRLVIKAFQERKQDEIHHPLLDQDARLAQIPFLQARVLARHLRGDIPDYVPLIPK